MIVQRTEAGVLGADGIVPDVRLQERERIPAVLLTLILNTIQAIAVLWVRGLILEAVLELVLKRRELTAVQER